MNKPYPAIHSILSAKTLADDVSVRFSFAPITECQLFSGGFNDTYRFKTSDNLTYYLRVYRIRWRTLADIQYELDVLNHLKGKGFPAAAPVADNDGSFFWVIPAVEGTRYAVVFEEAPGSEISYKENPVTIAYQYGEAVASMHNALDDFSSPHKRFHKDIDHFIDKPLHNIEPFLSHRPEDWSYLGSIAHKLKHRIMKMPAHSLEMGFCHGDLQGYHANVDSHGVLTFYDFDCGGYGFRAYDLAVFLWCCRLEDAVDPRWEPFIQGYRAGRQIHDLDVLAVPLFVCARYIWHMGVHTQNAPDWGIGPLNDEYFNKKLSQLREAENDYL